jgi:hypothetical protein
MVGNAIMAGSIRYSVAYAPVARQAGENQLE